LLTFAETFRAGVGVLPDSVSLLSVDRAFLTLEFRGIALLFLTLLFLEALPALALAVVTMPVVLAAALVLLLLLLLVSLLLALVVAALLVSLELAVGIVLTAVTVLDDFFPFDSTLLLVVLAVVDERLWETAGTELRFPVVRLPLMFDPFLECDGCENGSPQSSLNAKLFCGTG
jgi:hypothetical protein